MNELVAIDLPAGPEYLAALQDIWDHGNAALPLNFNDPQPHKRKLLKSLAATSVVSPGGLVSLPEGREVETGDAVVIASSGTSGEPKGAVHTFEGIEAAAYMTANASRSTPESKWVACLPLNHVGGFSVLTRALTSGAGLEIQHGINPSALEAAVESGATHTSLVPAAIQRIDPRRWTTILLGGSEIPQNRPSNTIATYGMTETFGGVVYDGLALSGAAVQISEGHVELKSPSMMRCYRDGSGSLRADGWYRTGDLGEVDLETGKLHVFGRADDLIVTGGEKVWPRDVENALKGFEGISELAVLGMTDAKWGETVAAAIVLTPDAQVPQLAEIRAHTKTTLPSYAAPTRLYFVEKLPSTSLGKVSRHTLRSVLNEGDQYE